MGRGGNEGQWGLDEGPTVNVGQLTEHGASKGRSLQLHKKSYHSK